MRSDFMLARTRHKRQMPSEWISTPLHISHTTHHILHIISHISHHTSHHITSHITHHISHITHYTSHITSHISHDASTSLLITSLHHHSHHHNIISYINTSTHTSMPTLVALIFLSPAASKQAVSLSVLWDTISDFFLLFFENYEKGVCVYVYVCPFACMCGSSSDVTAKVPALLACIRLPITIAAPRRYGGGKHGCVYMCCVVCICLCVCVCPYVRASVCVSICMCLCQYACAPICMCQYVCV